MSKEKRKGWNQWCWKAEPHRSVLKDFRLDSPLKWLCICPEQRWGCPRPAPGMSQVGVCSHRGEQDVHGSEVCLAWAGAAGGGWEQRTGVGNPALRCLLALLLLLLLPMAAVLWRWQRNPFCLRVMKSVLLETSARMSLPAPMHITRWEQVKRCTFSLRARERPCFTCRPQGILHPPGLCPFQAARLTYLLILSQQVHLTWSGQDAALLWLRHQPTNSPLIIPRYTKLTMQAPKHRNKGNNRFLM